MKKNIRLITIMIAVLSMVIIATVSANAVTEKSGRCGPNVTYSLSSTGVLTISGSGKMYDSIEDYRNLWEPSEIKEVIISTGVTSIGSYAFRGCSKLTSITIPEGVTSIGEYAFNRCSGLTSITIPEGVTSIGSEAFCFCSKLKYIYVFTNIKTTGSAGGLFCPFKGLFPAASQDALKDSPTARSFHGESKDSSFYFPTFSPVNGSIYSLKLIWSFAISSCN